MKDFTIDFWIREEVIKVIYWVAVTFKPKKKKDEEEPMEELIIEPKIVVAKTEQSAAMKVTMDNATKLKEYDHDRVSLFVRPF